VRRNFATAYVHQWLYDAESLAQPLREAGLAPGPPLGFREGGFPDLDQLEIREEGSSWRRRAPARSYSPRTTARSVHTAILRSSQSDQFAT